MNVYTRTLAICRRCFGDFSKKINKDPSMYVALSAFFLLFLYGSSAQAQEFTAARPLGMAEAYRAIATGNDAIDYNPAGLSVMQKYSVETQYVYDPRLGDHTAQLSVVDSMRPPMALGLSYFIDGTELQRRTTLRHTAVLAAATQIFPNTMHVGASFKYVNVSDAIAGNYLNALSADAGVLATLPGGLNLAAVGYNLIPIRSTQAPISAAFAAALDLGPISAFFAGANNSRSRVGSLVINPYSQVSPRGPLAGMTVSVDWRLNFATLFGTKSRVSGGVEYLVFDAIPLRGGYLWDEETGQHRVSFGAGYVNPLFGVDASYQQNLFFADDRSFAVALKLFFNPYTAR